jgi:hypothetical protein
MGSVSQELFKSPTDTRANREDMMGLLSIAGRVIGHTRDGKRAYVVYDGRVWLSDDPSPGSSMDYFEFCERVRRYTDVSPGVPMAAVLDFTPQSGFHLGWPKPQGECVGAQPGGWDNVQAMRETTPGAMRDAATPRPKNPGPEPSGPWGVRVLDGQWVSSFNNSTAAPDTTNNPGFAKQFDSRTEAEAWRQKYCPSLHSQVMPLRN